jgi:taurine dioxygenase
MRSYSNLAYSKLDSAFGEVDYLTPLIGAEVTKIDLGRLDDAMADWLKVLLAERKVLVFRDQHLDHAAHKKVGRIFGTGKLHIHHLIRGKTADDEITPVLTNAESAYNIGDGWHADVTCDPDPIAASLLYMKIMPEGGGGDTMFACMHECWNRLSEPVKALLTPLTALHDGGFAYGVGYGLGADKEREYNRSDHPVVIDHPVTGKKTLFVNAAFTTQINGLSAPESRAILDMLFRHIDLTVTAQVRIRWAKDTLVMWDNVATQHQAVWDYFPQTRLAERVSVIGRRIDGG